MLYDVNKKKTLFQVEQAKLTRQAGINILVVGISQWVNMMEIHEMATDPDAANAFLVDNFDDFGQIINGLEQSLCDGKGSYCSMGDFPVQLF